MSNPGNKQALLSRCMWEHLNEQRVGSEDFTVTDNEDPEEAGRFATTAWSLLLDFKEAPEGLDTAGVFVFGGHTVRSIITHGSS